MSDMSRPEDGTTAGSGGDAIYTLYPVFKAARKLRKELTDPDDRRAAAQEIENLYKSWEGRVDVRGTYSTVGFRPDADVMLWLIGRSPQELQRAVVELRRTPLGRRLELTWSFMGVVKPAEFTPDHAPAFVKGVPPETFLCVYPFVRTAEWYLLPPQERGALLAEHGGAGREFPEILTNTTSAFGLGDWEWILAFEAARMDSIVDCIRRLRETKARLYTKVEVPFVTGIRKPMADVLADLA
jgi:hydrogen peroxide-dependent heme synthase